MIGQPDIDGNGWNGNAHYAPNNATYHLYITYSLNALDENPIFHTQGYYDPVQVGSICLNSGDCRDIGGSNRNLWTLMTCISMKRKSLCCIRWMYGNCATSNNSTASDSRDGRGSVYYLQAVQVYLRHLTKCLFCDYQ